MNVNECILTRVVDRPDVHALAQRFVHVAAGAAAGGVGTGTSRRMRPLDDHLACVLHRLDFESGAF